MSVEPQNVTLTIRVIKSFPFRNVKPIILLNYDINNNSAKDLYEDCMQHIQKTGAFLPFRKTPFDFLKVYNHAQRTKSLNLVVNFDHDDDSNWILDIENEGKKLSEYDISNETEISMFVLKDYLTFKENPEEKW
ncbi:hypothetical protein HANVADRAFT_24803 [Hanseniaspora valbyensis NRRL Y-1626]|uniref:Altered inheritance rate of mitochondria protein 29 n=1 Tax=Hanseniaspora valbyensis NRRL Y-1626 TaxID=766949 RepID=A0A1B7TD57_9ASCO|nr:hypothetical protein HANVADRAFT_24803 [Hanseniaspora valbyensis NRRL Y-1626]